MFVWARTPLRFIFLGVIGGGILFGYVILELGLGFPENQALAIGMMIFCPIATVWEIRWRINSGYELEDGKMASVFGIPTWIVNAGLSILTIIGLVTGIYK